MDQQNQCPICQQWFPVNELQQHVELCLDTLENQPFLLPHTTQQAFPSPQNITESAKFQCQRCDGSFVIEQLYSLDECSHKFCYHCIGNHINDQIQTEIVVVCPVQHCSKALSVRDMQLFLPHKKPQSQQPSQIRPQLAAYTTSSPSVTGASSASTFSSGFAPKVGSQKASQRIMKEYKSIIESQLDKHGISVETINDNIYHWEVKFFDFEKGTPLAADLAANRCNHILLHVVFPVNYPFEPPFVRVIRPRFQYRTGHVTVGGSICMELLTSSGWSPANTIEAVLLSIRSNLIDGGARLDSYNRHDYTEREAQEAFRRVAAQHGWQ